MFVGGIGAAIQAVISPGSPSCNAGLNVIVITLYSLYHADVVFSFT